MENVKIKKLIVGEAIPYELLLLADETLESINRYIHNCDIFVYEIKEKLIAVYALQELDNDTVEIKNIAVVEEYQGNGIGKKLLQDASEKGIEKECKVILIGTGDASLKQLALYQKMGFEKFTTKENFFLNNYPEPIYENGIQLKHMIMLKRDLNKKQIVR